MTETQAKAVADEYTATHPLEHHDYEMVVTKGRECDAGWLFDFSTICKKDIPSEEQETFAGAPALLIQKSTGTARVVGWQEYWKMTKAANNTSHRTGNPDGSTSGEG